MRDREWLEKAKCLTPALKNFSYRLRDGHPMLQQPWGSTYPTTARVEDSKPQDLVAVRTPIYLPPPPSPERLRGHKGVYQGHPAAWTCCGLKHFSDECECDKVDVIMSHSMARGRCRANTSMAHGGRESDIDPAARAIFYGGLSPDNLAYRPTQRRFAPLVVQRMVPSAVGLPIRTSIQAPSFTAISNERYRWKTNDGFQRTSKEVFRKC